ncbi:islet cell autoantigen 1-like isoform X3 [Pundamilia nyererei]|uniref:Islet cell autoantigen 1-like isoform X3 n=1 Tax=Pundamilia nyererei TaxID=303518 RepID=A0A9Y3RMH2_9CICH|nr:PREDICTED: islet cell autoantigen 1-like protein isoform X3 [Pundamilia nyererei]
MDGFAGDMLSGGRALLGEDSSVMARMQKKFWKTKQVLIKATGKKEDEYVVASDADLDAKLEFFRSVQSTCTELLKVIEKYQHRITRLSQEENELGLFLRFQAEHDRTKAGNMMDATSKALCASAKQRMALCPSLHRLHQEVETFRRRAISDTLLTVTCMEKARTEYRGALLWMKDISQELDPDTYKQLEKFRKVQAQVRGTKSQFEKLKNDVCQKVDMLGASRCNMLSHSLCTYQTTLLQFWEKTAQAMSEIHKAFQGHVPYQFTTLKDLWDPLEQISDSKKQEEKEKAALQSNTESLLSLDDDNLSGSATDAYLPLSSDGQRQTDDCDGSLHTGRQPQEDGEPGDMAFLKDLLSPGSGASDEFSKEWQDAFGMFTSPSVPTTSQGAQSGATAARPPSNPPSPTGFLPSQLLDHSLSSTGWATPPMFQAPPLQVPQSPNQSAQPAPKFAGNATPGGSKDMSAWFNLFADLDPLSNPDAIGRSADELLNA